MEEEILKLQNEWNILTRELKDMSCTDPNYGKVWNERIEVGIKLRKLKNRVLGIGQ